MAIFKIYPEKDTTLYTEYLDTNTGVDAILEASTYIKNDTAQVCRYLMKFSTTEINDIINNKISTSPSNSGSGQQHGHPEQLVHFHVYLKNYKAVLTGLNLDSKLMVYPISGSWGMGTGHFGDSPKVTNGASWYWQDYSGSYRWPTTNFGAFATGSFTGSLPGGGVWYTASGEGLNVEHSQSFNYSDNKDLNVDVTNTILTWYSGGLPNEGFIIKQPSNDEFVYNRNKEAFFKYFSIDTNTIYPPQLEFKWDDYTFNTGSSTNTILTKAESFISMYNNVGTYYSESISRFRVAAVPKYIRRTFMTSSAYSTNSYLPPDVSFYAVKDTETNEFVIDFDSNFTKISADSESSYFDIYMAGLEPERYYTILIKTTIENNVKVFDENIIFKVVNG